MVSKSLKISFVAFAFVLGGSFLSGCSDSSVGVPGGADLNTPEEQKKVEAHYKEMAESGRGPGGGETGPPGGKL